MGKLGLIRLITCISFCEFTEKEMSLTLPVKLRSVCQCLLFTVSFNQPGPVQKKSSL